MENQLIARALAGHAQRVNHRCARSRRRSQGRGAAFPRVACKRIWSAGRCAEKQQQQQQQQEAGNEAINRFNKPNPNGQISALAERARARPSKPQRSRNFPLAQLISFAAAGQVVAGNVRSTWPLACRHHTTTATTTKQSCSRATMMDAQAQAQARSRDVDLNLARA